jgi:hypothetical protein
VRHFEGNFNLAGMELFFASPAAGWEWWRQQLLMSYGYA